MLKLYILALPSALSFAVPAAPIDYSVEGFEGIQCDSDMECEEATGYPYDTSFDPDAPKYPRLVGHGCKGADGPIYAFEEDHFPVCREILPMDWDWREELDSAS